VTATPNTAGNEKFDLAILCGYGTLPVEIADEARASGRNPFLIGIEGEAEPAIERFPSQYLAWGQLGKLLRLLSDLGIQEVVFAGGVAKRPEIHKLKLDWGAIKSLPQILAFMIGGDNLALSGSISLLESWGLTVVGAHEIAPSLLAAIGPIGTKSPGKHELANLRLGYSVCKAMGRYDIGQASVAEAGRIVALEGVEGTDLMLERIAEMRRIGRMPAKGRFGVLVKTMKPGQDPRADLPAIGPATIDGAVAAGLRGIGLEAGRALILERGRTFAAAKQAGIFIYGLSQDEVAPDDV
jgi:UDP-2,3-diacylglucosamine hydrolase